MARTKKTLSNQVFIGCAFAYRSKYEELVEDYLNKKYPLAYVLIGDSGQRQDAEDLLKLIKDKLFRSSFAIFDATSGNPNVSLEYGLVEGREKFQKALYVSRHGAHKKKTESAIIADLAGKWRNEYKTQRGLKRLLDKAAADHPYRKRFETFLKKTSRGQRDWHNKKKFRHLCLKIIHCLDGLEQRKRLEIVEALSINYQRKEIEVALSKLHNAGLIRCKSGGHSLVNIN